MTHAHQLLDSLISLHSEHSSDQTIEQSLRTIDTVISEAGANQSLNDLVNETLSLDGPEEILAEMAEHTQSDPMIEFYQNILGHISCHISEALIDGQKQNVQAEVFAMPTFGNHNIIRSIHERRGFSDLLQESGVIPPKGRMVLFGMLPLHEATSLVTDPQKMYDFTQNAIDLLSKDQTGDLDTQFQSIKDHIGVRQKPHDHGNAIVYGGYLIVGAYLSMMNMEQTSLLSMGDVDEDTIDAFAQMKNDWSNRQPDAKELEETDIFPPMNLLQATGIALANSTFNSVLIENSIGAPYDVEIAKIEVSIPDKQLGEKDRAVITFYDPQDQMISFIYVNAPAFYMMLPVAVDYWEATCGCQVSIVPQDEDQVSAPSIKRTLH